MFQSIARLQAETESRLAAISFHANPDTLYEPIRYMLALGGKRMRPVLTLMGHELYSDDATRAWPAALGIEVFHNFTLLHDDIMDKAPLRRGKSTVHERWNSNVAILSGDAMFVRSCQLMMESPVSVMPSVMNMFLETALLVCEGQQLDMDFETREHVEIPEYLEMIRLKTAVLLGASLGIGACIGGAATGDVNHLYTFGVNLGVAFQLQDDILDVYGDAEKFGKQVGGDILANKKTFLLLTAIERARDNDADELQSWLNDKGNDPEAKVKAVTAIYDRLGVKDAAIQKMDKLYNEAMHHLDALPLATGKTSSLKELAAMLMQREN